MLEHFWQQWLCFSLPWRWSLGRLLQAQVWWIQLSPSQLIRETKTNLKELCLSQECLLYFQEKIIQTINHVAKWLPTNHEPNRALEGLRHDIRYTDWRTCRIIITDHSKMNEILAFQALTIYFPLRERLNYESVFTNHWKLVHLWIALIWFSS